MANTIKFIELGKIKPNPLNNRSMGEEEIENIRDSIVEVGLLNPLIVYEDGPDEYTLISGHKRFSALKSLGRAGSNVQCIIVPKPSNENREIEMMSRANVHRSSPEAIKNEVEIASKLWDNLEDGRKKSLTEKFKLKFEENNAGNPLFIQDSEKFTHQRFRPRLIYINSITGLNMGNRTIQSYLTGKLKDEGEALETDTPSKKEKQVTAKVLIKSMQSLKGLIQTYKTTTEDTIPIFLDELETQLEEVIESLKGEC